MPQPGDDDSRRPPAQAGLAASKSAPQPPLKMEPCAGNAGKDGKELGDEVAAAEAAYARVAPNATAAQLRKTTASLDFRRAQLRALAQMIKANRAALADALSRDLRKCEHEAGLTEIDPLISEIALALLNLDLWARPMFAPRSAATAFGMSRCAPSPRGLVLIIAPWNYPLRLLVAPLVSAIAAGNAAIIKPSELAPATAQVIATLLPRYLDARLYATAVGGREVSTALLARPFDMIFFTGSAGVARFVMAAAALHLTPLVLELGGKSPVVLHPSCDVAVAARRIAFGKFLNCGQTCVAPDYVLCPRAMLPTFLHHVARAVYEFYGASARDSPSYGRIIGHAHFNRLLAMMRATELGSKLESGGAQSSPTVGTAALTASESASSAANTASLSTSAALTQSTSPATRRGSGVLSCSARIAALGGASECTPEDLFIPPTVYIDVDCDGVLMQEEIFGPILPVVVFDTSSAEQVADYVMKKGAPLAEYIFSTDDAYTELLISSTRSGGVVVNDTVMQIAVEGVPFGGVGASGFGKYHGKFGFDEFSHLRPTVYRSMGMEFLNNIRYPPYSDTKSSFVKKLLYRDVYQ